MIIDEANKIALGFQIGEGLQTQSGIQLPEYQISSKKYLWFKWVKCKGQVILNANFLVLI